MTTHGRKTCGELILSASLVLTDFRELIPEIMAQKSPNAANHLILEHPPQDVNGRVISQLAKAAQALRTISRDFPEEISHIERMFGLTLK